MTPGEFREFAKAMQEFGLSEAVIDGCTLKMGAHHPVPAQAQNIVTMTPFVAPISDPEDPIKHKVEQLTSLLKVSDVELVDALFPDHTEEEAI